MTNPAGQNPVYQLEFVAEAEVTRAEDKTTQEPEKK